MAELPTTTRIPYTIINTYNNINRDNGKGSGVGTTIYNQNNKRINNSDLSGSIALIISIIAGALIAIILIILLILKFKGRPDVRYKIDEGKSFCQEPSAALLGGAAGAAPVHQGGQVSYNGALRNGQGGSKNGKKRELKDIKEWYV